MIALFNAIAIGFQGNGNLLLSGVLIGVVLGMAWAVLLLFGVPALIRELARQLRDTSKRTGNLMQILGAVVILGGVVMLLEKVRAGHVDASTVMHSVGMICIGAGIVSFVNWYNNDSVAYCQQHPPDFTHRCKECDRFTVELREHGCVEGAEVYDRYECAGCGVAIRVITTRDPSALYD